MPIVFALLFIFAAAPALAYIGPGPGLSMAGSLLAVVGILFAALIMVIVYPLRLLRRWRKSRAAGSDKRDA